MWRRDNVPAGHKKKVSRQWRLPKEGSGDRQTDRHKPLPIAQVGHNPQQQHREDKSLDHSFRELTLEKRESHQRHLQELNSDRSEITNLSSRSNKSLCTH
jgi:hypothetical protein